MGKYSLALLLTVMNLFLPVCPVLAQPATDAGIPETTTAPTRVSGDSNFVLDSNPPAVKSGNIYMSSKKKDELLLKTNIWGSVHFPGIHYVPVGTNLLSAISIAGGPTAEAETEGVTLATNGKTGVVVRDYSLADALRGGENMNPTLKPGDTIFIKRNETKQNVTFWLTIGTFLISAAAFSYIVYDHHHQP